MESPWSDWGRSCQPAATASRLGNDQLLLLLTRVSLNTKLLTVKMSRQANCLPMWLRHRSDLTHPHQASDP